VVRYESGDLVRGSGGARAIAVRTDGILVALAEHNRLTSPGYSLPATAYQRLTSHQPPTS